MGSDEMQPSAFIDDQLIRKDALNNNQDCEMQHLHFINDQWIRQSALSIKEQGERRPAPHFVIGRNKGEGPLTKVQG